MIIFKRYLKTLILMPFLLLVAEGSHYTIKHPWKFSGFENGAAVLHQWAAKSLLFNYHGYLCLVMLWLTYHIFTPNVFESFVLVIVFTHVFGKVVPRILLTIIGGPSVTKRWHGGFIMNIIYMLYIIIYNNIISSDWAAKPVRSFGISKGNL